MAILVVLFLTLFGTSIVQGGHTNEDCCLTELCPFDCIRCDGQPTCFDLSDELGCDNKTDANLRSYRKPSIFIPAVMDLIKQHLLQQKQAMASTYTHRTCIRQVGYNTIDRHSKTPTTAFPPWLTLLEQLKSPDVQTTTTTQAPVWLQLLQKLQSEASTTTTTTRTTTTTPMPTTTSRPTSTTEMPLLDILLEWLHTKEQELKASESQTVNGYTQHNIPKTSEKTNINDKSKPVSQASQTIPSTTNTLPIITTSSPKGFKEATMPASLFIATSNTSLANFSTSSLPTVPSTDRTLSLGQNITTSALEHHTATFPNEFTSTSTVSGIQTSDNIKSTTQSEIITKQYYRDFTTANEILNEIKFNETSHNMSKALLMSGSFKQQIISPTGFSDTAGFSSDLMSTQSSGFSDQSAEFSTQAHVLSTESSGLFTNTIDLNITANFAYAHSNSSELSNHSAEPFTTSNMTIDYNITDNLSDDYSNSSRLSNQSSEISNQISVLLNQSTGFSTQSSRSFSNISSDITSDFNVLTNFSDGLSNFRQHVPTVTTSYDGQRSSTQTMKLFINLADMVASTPSLQTKQNAYVSPTTASKTITSLFPDPTQAYHAAQPEYNTSRLHGAINYTSIYRPLLRDNAYIPKETKLVGRVSVYEEPNDKISSHSNATKQIDRKTYVYSNSENMQVYPIQRFVEPVLHSNTINIIPTSQTAAALPSVVQNHNQLSATDQNPSWWQTTRSPFDFSNLWGGTTYPATTSSWWAPTTSNYFWNSLFGYPQTTQRNFVLFDRFNNPSVNPLTVPHQVIQTTPNTAPPTETQLPRYQVPATTVPSVVTVQQPVVTTSRVQQLPSTTPPNIYASSNMATRTPFESSFTTEGTLRELSSSAKLGIPIVAFNTPSSVVTNTYLPAENQYNIISTDNLGNRTVPYSIDTSLSYLRKLYLDILAAQRNLEARYNTPAYTSVLDNSNTSTEPGGISINTTTFSTVTARQTQEFVKPYIAARSNVKQTDIEWWHTPAKSNRTSTGTPRTAPTTTTTVLSTDQWKDTSQANNESYTSTYTQPLAHSSSMNTKPNNIVNSSTKMRMSNMLGISIPDFYPTVKSISNFEFNPNGISGNEETATQENIRPTPSNIGGISVAYDISKPTLAEWTVPQGQGLSKSKSPSRQSWWDKIITAVTESSKGTVNNRTPMETKTVTYNFFQTTTSPPHVQYTNINIPSSPAYNTAGKENTLLYYDVTLKTPIGKPQSTLETKDCKLIQDGGEFCSSRLSGYYKNPYDCRTFFVCKWSDRYRCPCPADTLFDDTHNVCNWAYKVTC